MNTIKSLWFFAASFWFAFSAHAEDWPTLEAFVRDCVLIVEARQIGLPKPENEPMMFQVVDSWKGSFSPDLFEYTTGEGYIVAAEGEHGVNVTSSGQRIIFFFTKRNQKGPRLSCHSAAFPIVDGQVVYAGTGNPGQERSFTVEEFRKAILRVESKE